MRTTRFVTDVKREIERFAENDCGNIAFIFALALVPLLGMAGAAMDYGRASMVRTQMQASSDATVLALSSEAATDTNSQLQTNARNVFLANFNQPDAQNLSVSAIFSTSGGSNIVLTASASLPTSFLGIIGIRSIPLTTTSTAKWGTSRLRVALVLDNTGSMSQSGKMSALKTAAANFLSQLQTAAVNNGDIYVSIIPFAAAVNVGSTNYAQSWLTWTDFGSCGGWGFFGIFGSGYTQALCSSTGGSWTTYSSSQRSNWTGCVTDRGDVTGPNGGNYDTNVVAPTGATAASLFPAVQYSACPQQAMGQSYNWATMTNLINNMQPNGTTNQNIGLELGWMSLGGGGPFTAPTTVSGYTYKYVVVLFTDGLNTEDHWYTAQSSIDARQTVTCNNIKAASIQIYTVQISTDGTPMSSLLQNCATDSSKYFYLTSASEVISTFNSIGTNLSNLYLSQ
jgi:Flp pilus assembly protein TadG